MIANEIAMARTATLALAASLVSIAAASAGSPRVTSTVKLIRKISPAIVPIFCQESDGRASCGTGTVVHEDGFILTADHVTRDRPGVVIFGKTRTPYTLVGRIPEKDMAVLKVAAPRPLACRALWRPRIIRRTTGTTSSSSTRPPIAAIPAVRS